MTWVAGVLSSKTRHEAFSVSKAVEQWRFAEYHIGCRSWDERIVGRRPLQTNND